MQLEHPSGAYVKVIADSITTDALGKPRRLFTVEVKHHRFVLAELATHDGSIARNSASSRAIPFPKMLAKFRQDPAWPVEWPAEQPGMMGGSDLQGQDQYDAKGLWLGLHNQTHRKLWEYLDEHPESETRLHKSLLNRWLEPVLWHTTLLTGVYWQNFFNQRDDKAAMPELRIIAEMIHQAYDTHVPIELEQGDWHVPYINDAGHITRDEIHFGGNDLREMSASRCAQTSYAAAGTTGYAKDVERYQRLIESKPPHISPLEHPATPMPLNVHKARLTDPDNGRTLGFRELPKFGRFPGWMCWRHVVEGRMNHVSTQ